ncbi:hypothetical protein [Aeromonas hydrophila]|uniref:hypothetical protein n=1 Tax=Aeromonas hydrophila TaxID=644 RepID=UPI001F605A8F|nr:hypothetical protein [Aeromonas hydrophila]UNU29658.1 hypothetical protein GCK65_11330 [Aeromonas hydrophila]
MQTQSIIDTHLVNLQRIHSAMDEVKNPASIIDVEAIRNVLEERANKLLIDSLDKALINEDIPSTKEALEAQLFLLNKAVDGAGIKDGGLTRINGDFFKCNISVSRFDEILKEQREALYNAL